MGKDMRESAALHRVKQGYTTGARSLASRSIVGLARTRVTPNALTTAGVSLCLGASVLVFFEYRHELLFYWLGAFVFVVGSVLDILDGADRKSTRLNSSHQIISYAVFCLKKKKQSPHSSLQHR